MKIYLLIYHLLIIEKYKKLDQCVNSGKSDQYILV